MVNAAVAVVGLALVWLALYDVFQSVIVPRAVNRRWRAAAHLTRAAWRVWRALARTISDGVRRENFLSTFAPFNLVASLAMWVVMLVVGFGCVLFALRAQLRPADVSFPSALYLAGTSLLTIGFGDIVGRAGLARLVTLAAGASGLSVVAVVTAFLFAVFGSFQRREAQVVVIGARSGSAPSGVGLLTVAGHARLRASLAPVLRSAQSWIAEVMESHLAYPILVYFRSSHDDESWVATLGTLMDASALLMTTIDGGDEGDGEASITFAIGRHAAHDITHYFGIPALGSGPGIIRSEFEEACDRLEAAGFQLCRRDEAWEKFSALRSTYAAPLNAIARWLEIPPVQWIGDRSLIAAPVHTIERHPA